MKQNIFVVIPAFNEKPSILETTLTKIIEKGYEVVLVDDGSTDELHVNEKRASIHCLRHSINLGQGAALQTGMDYALLCGADIIVHFDADGQHEANDIDKFVNKLREGYDVILGSRFLDSKDREAVPKGRRLILRIARIVNGIFTGLWLSDAHNGFRAFSRPAVMKIRIRENRMAHATEILHLIKKQKLKYCEMPTRITYSDYSKAKGQNAINSVNILIDVIKNKIL
ncbi:glycosyltransferase family 2 protein [Flammeovirgaceae bacterium]